MVEFVLMVPFLITFLVFVYQVYVMVHKAQVSQKYLKLALITDLGNRADGHLDPNQQASGNNIANFFEVFDEANKMMTFDIDPVTQSLLLSFASSQQSARLKKVFSSFAAGEELGVCLGTNLKSETNPDLANFVFQPWTCHS